MKNVLALATALTAFAGSAVALEVPKACGSDPAVLCVPYSPSDVVSVTLSPNMPTVIVLHPGESMLDGPMTGESGFDLKPFPCHASGTKGADGKPGQICGNNIMIQPVQTEVGHSEHLTVLTQDQSGTQRLYPLVLNVEASGAPQVLRYTFPAEIAKERREKAAEAAKHHEDDEVKSHLHVSPFYGSGYTQVSHDFYCRCAHGQDIIPDDESDNGQSTTFRYRGIRSAPAFYALSPNGKHETPVVTTRIGDVYVAPVTSKFWVLRAGSEVIELYDAAQNAGRAGWGTGTTSPDVVKELR